MKDFYFIAGASGSGKTAIIPDLRKSLGDEFLVCDFDDIGVPEEANKKWRQESTEKWLQKLLKEDKKTCLVGQMVLGEILACPSVSGLGEITFILLDVEDSVRVERLKKRNTHGADQHTLNWAAWLRVHHHNPRWMQHVIKEDCWEGLDFSHWDQLESWGDKACIQVLDTTHLSTGEVASDVVNWII